jgi:hypothetical protein
MSFNLLCRIPSLESELHNFCLLRGENVTNRTKFQWKKIQKFGRKIRLNNYETAYVRLDYKRDKNVFSFCYKLPKLESISLIG